jgi:hypothetical protein
MKQLPDILTSASFWAQIATMWAASGAWFTYVAAVVESRQQTYAGILNLVHGLEAEFALISEWARGGEGDLGYIKKTRDKLGAERTDWFNPSRAVFKFGAPTLNNVTSSPYASYMAPVINPLVVLNHSIRRIFENIDRYQAFVYGDTKLYQSVLKKFAPATTPLDRPQQIVTPHPAKVGLTPEEEIYVNHIFMMNETIHQGLIGGADSDNEICLYKTFRSARKAVQDFKSRLKPEPLPDWFGFLHFAAGLIAFVGFWEVMRWLEIW